MAVTSTRVIYKGYTGVSIQVPNNSTPVQLLALLQANNVQSPVRAKYFVVQIDPKRSTANLLIGEKATDDQGNSNPTALSSTNYGACLVPGDSETFGGYWGDEFVNISRFWLLNDATGTGVLWLNIQTVRG